MNMFAGMHKGRWYVVGCLVVIGVTLYVYLEHTSQGRLLGLYTVGGWNAPGEVRQACKTESATRVAELFTLPLAINDDAKQALREYWHYSYYRECLYRAGYTFMGKPLAQSALTLRASGNEMRYSNPLAGISLTLPPDTQLLTSNELDVMFDYRLLRSTLRFATTTLLIDTYTTHEYIKTFDDLPAYLDHFPASQSAFVLSEQRTTMHGVPYFYVEDEDHLCGAILVTPESLIVHIYASCADRETVLDVTDTLVFDANAATVH